MFLMKTKKMYYWLITLGSIFILAIPAYAIVYTYDYDDSNRLKSVTYDSYIKIVYSYDDNGNLCNVQVLELVPPSWPQGSALTTSDISTDSLTLSWTAAEDNSGVTQYRIYKNEALLDTVDETVTTFEVTGLEPGTEYSFKVEAGDAYDNWSDALSLTVMTIDGLSHSLLEAEDDAENRKSVGPNINETIVPVSDTEAPTWGDAILIVTDVSTNSLTLTWSAAEDNVEVNGYRIYQDGILLATVSGSTTMFEATGLEDNTTYTFKVEAGDESDNWTNNGPSITVTTDVIPPTWPQGSTLTDSLVTSFDVFQEWTSEDIIGVTGYRIKHDGIPVREVNLFSNLEHIGWSR